MKFFYSCCGKFQVISVFFSTLFLAFANFAFADGAKLFKQNCARCHLLSDKRLTGPGLKDVMSRVPGDEWLFNWIKNNKEMIRKGDAYALKIYNEYNQQSMDVMDGVITDDEINEIIAYIKNPPAEMVATADDGTHPKHPLEEGISPWTVLIIVLLALLALLAVLGTVKRSLQDAVNAKKGLPPSEPETFFKWIAAHKRLTALIGIVLITWAAKAAFEAMMGVAIYEGYKPEQPIKFSHQTHAGKLQINCVYCHSGAEKGKTAGVPSANVCMNCHKAISSGSKTGETEIAKIYDAVGWDPAKGIYDETKQHPIEWVRVYALPDFAYFNHSQHVVVGKQDCKNCHGEVEKMDEAEQVSPLTMAWCVDCHRKTEVPGMAAHNPYYEELHEKLAKKYKGQPITVEKIGGLDCIKCHY